MTQISPQTIPMSTSPAGDRQPRVSWFVTHALGESAGDAFTRAVDRARWELGPDLHAPTIAAKESFIMIDDAPEDLRARLDERWADLPAPHDEKMLVAGRLVRPRGTWRAHAIAEALRLLRDLRLADALGPAGCVEAGPALGEPDLREYVFFGWAVR